MSERLKPEHREPEHPEFEICQGCGNEIDPETCHCGSPVDMHGMGDGHLPVPMGCTCGYTDAAFGDGFDD